MTTLQTSMWNERYSQVEFAYGKAPNAFFQRELLKLEPANILLPAEGEGRNAVFAAQNGWHVTAFDQSDAGRNKAWQLAKENHVSIAYEICAFEVFNAPPSFFSAIGLIYAHVPSAQRRQLHRNLFRFLKPGGRIILEAFSKKQLELGRPSGGPKDPDLLYSVEDLLLDFEDLHEVEISEESIVLNEGPYHQGEAEVVRMVAIK